MKTFFFVFFINAILLNTNSVQAESKVLLRLNLQKGTTYEMIIATTNDIDQEMTGKKMKMEQKMEMVFSYHVLDVLPNKNFLIEYSMMGMNMKMKMNGQEMNFDSESADTSNPVNASLKSLVSNKLKLELSPKGQVERIEGLEEYAKNISQNPQMAQSMQMFTDEKNFKSFIGQTFSYFPEDNVAEGDKWTSTFKLPALMNMETVMNFEVDDIKTDQIALNVTSDVNLDSAVEQMGIKINMKMTGTQNGTMNIDLADGWLRSSDLTQKFDVNMKMKNPKTGEDMEIPMLMNSVSKITVFKK